LRCEIKFLFSAVISIGFAFGLRSPLFSPNFFSFWSLFFPFAPFVPGLLPFPPPLCLCCGDYLADVTAFSFCARSLDLVQQASLVLSLSVAGVLFVPEPMMVVGRHRFFFFFAFVPFFLTVFFWKVFFFLPLYGAFFPGNHLGMAVAPQQTPFFASFSFSFAGFHLDGSCLKFPSPPLSRNIYSQVPAYSLDRTRSVCWLDDYTLPFFSAF